MASQTFSNEAVLYKNASGQYAVKYAFSNTKSVITDLAYGNSSDNLSILGDISPDYYSFNSGLGPHKQTYVGLSPNGTGILGTAPSKNGGTFYYIFSNNSYTIGQVINPKTTPRGQFALCFRSGTAIRTTRGDIAVEHLRVGDLAVTAGGTARPIIWIGRRDLGSDAPIASDQWPVRVSAGAFDGSVPVRDLYLSPGHPVLVGADEDGHGGALVPIMCLINGTTVERVECSSVTYWHVELDAHDILLAEGLAAESYLDLGSRAFFEESSDHPLHDPDHVAPRSAGRCRPVALDGAVVEAARCKLDSRFADQLVAQCAWQDSGDAILFC